MKNLTRGERYASDHAKDLGEKLRQGAVAIAHLLNAIQGHETLSIPQAVELGAEAGRWIAEAHAIAGELES